MTATQPETRHEDAVEPSEETGSSPAGASTAPIVETGPTIRPVLIWMGIAVVIAVGVVALIASNAEALGGQDLAGILVQAVVVLTVVVVARFVIRAAILTRTTYEVTGETVRRRYTLLMRTRVREVPTDRIRSSELRQSRIQKLLGYGTIAINQGLGEIRLEHVEEPMAVRNAIGQVIESESQSEL